MQIFNRYNYEACTRTRTVPYCTVLYFSFIVSLYVSDLCNVTKYCTSTVLVALLYEYRTAVGTSTETMNHIFQKNAIEFETGITRHETIRHDSVCDVIYFRIFIDTFD